MTKQTSFYDELISSDWMGRNPADYTYTKKGASMGWENTLTDGDAFSNFIQKVSAKTLTDTRKMLITKQACSSVISRMNIGKKPIQISFTNELKSYQQGNQIQVSIEPLGSKISFPTFNHRLDPVLGFCVHEMAHLLYTDEQFDRYLDKFNGAEADIKKGILNILEDERIENEVASSFRGFTNYIGKAKDYVFGIKFKEALKNLQQTNTEDDLTKLFETFVHFIRYPRALREDLVNEFESEVTEIKKILTPYPSNCKGLIEACNSIYEVFKKFVNDQQDQDDQQQQSGQSSQQKSTAKAQAGQGNKQSNQKQDKQNPTPKNDQNKDEQSESEGQSKEDKESEGNDKKQPNKGKGGKKDKQDKTDQDKENEENDGDKNSDGTNNPSDKEDTEKDGEEENSDGANGENDGEPKEDVGDKEMGEMMKGLMKALGAAMPNVGDAKEMAMLAALGDYNAPNIVKQISQFNNEETAAMMGSSHKFPQTENLHPSEMTVIFREAKEIDGVTNNYDKALDDVRGYAASLRAKIQKLNRSHQYTQRGLAEGDFDEGLLVDSIVGAKNVYKQDTKIMNRGAVVGLLIDESGSMGGGYYSNDGKWFNAMKIAVMFERALEGVNGVDFYCYGHTTDNIGYCTDATLIHVYYEGRKKSERKSLGKIYAHNTNRDGHAILETVCRMRERSKIPMNVPIILFMISDGEPSASVPHGYNGKTYTKHCVKFVEKNLNATIIHVAIEKGIPSKEMFDNYVSFTDFSTLTQDVGKLLTKIITKNQAPIELSL